MSDKMCQTETDQEIKSNAGEKKEKKKKRKNSSVGSGWGEGGPGISAEAVSSATRPQISLRKWMDGLLFECTYRQITKILYIYLHL